MGFSSFYQIYDSHNKICGGSARVVAEYSEFKVKVSLFVKPLNCQARTEIELKAS